MPDRLISAAVGPDGTVYVPCHDGNLYAIHADGTEYWAAALRGMTWSAPAVGLDGAIYTSADDKLIALNADGSRRWTAKVAYVGSQSSPTVGPDGTVYICCANQELYAVDSAGQIKWTFLTGDDIRSTPALAVDGSLRFCSADGNLYAVEADGSLRWAYHTSGIQWSSPSISAEGVTYVGAEDGCLHAVNSDGTLRWRTELGDSVRTPVVGPDGTIYVSHSGSEAEGGYAMCALDSEGGVRWRYRLDRAAPYSPAIGPGGELYFVTGVTNPATALRQKVQYVTSNGHGRLYALSSDGQVKWRIDFKDDVRCSPALSADGVLYVTSNSGKLYAIGLEQ
jgi:outer membrane protein assembly factor BamB